MNDYLEKLGRALGRMSAGEREEILADFREHFLAAHAAGKTDAQIAAGLGDPQQVGRMYRAEHAVEGAQRAGGLKSVLRMLGAVARYKLLGGLLIACLYFATLCTALVLFAFAFAILCAGSACLVYGVLVLVKGYAPYALLGGFLTLFFTGLGLLGLRGGAIFWRATLGQLPLATRSIMHIGRKEQ